MAVVWIFEDTVYLRRAYVRFVGSVVGVTPVGFASAEEGTDALRRGERPDGILLDQNLPGQKGLDWVGAQLLELGGVRVLCLTGDARSETSWQALQLGAKLVLKPAKHAQLAEYARDVLRDARVRAAARDLDPELAGAAEAFVARWKLSPREAEVLVLILHGMSYVDVARELRIVPVTVKQHAARIRERSHLARMSEVVVEIRDDAVRRRLLRAG